MKEVQDRVVQFSNRYKLTNAETGTELGTYDFEEVTGTVQQVGTEIDKELFDSISDDLAARVKLSGGELADTIVTFPDISDTAANVASGDTSATLWGKVKNWFSRLKALAFKNKVAAGDFEAGAIKNADVAADAAIAQSKVSGLMTDYVASISVSGRTVTYKNKNGVNMGSITTQDTTYNVASQSSNGLMSSTDKTKLDGIESGAQKNTVLGVKGNSESAYRTGNVNITKANIGLGNVDNTSDEDKPVSTAMQTALNGKANTSGTYPNLTAGKATNADNATNATNATNAANATKATQDASGNVITSTYATKKELSSGLSGKANTSGSYPNLTVGNAEKLGNKAASEYALNNGLRNTAPTIKTQNTWYRKTWNGITTFDGRNIWTDGENIYYSYDAEQYVLNRATSTWDKKTWNGIDGDNRMRGVDIWSDGKTIYYSHASLQYVLDKTSSTWNPKTWRDITDIGLEIYGSDIWTDGENIYFSHYRSGQYRLLPSGQWEEISWTWNGTDRSGIITTGLWIDGNHIYYSNAGENYELNKSTMTWELKSWNRDTSITEKEFSCLCGACIWSDGETIYCSSDSRYVDGLVRAQFYLDKNTSTWMPKEWLGLDSSLIFYSGNSLWSDGNNIYYSEDTEQYVLAELIKSTRPILNH